MKWENIQTGNKIYDEVINFKKPEILEQIVHLDKDDALETLSHLNAKFMNALVNSEWEFRDKKNVDDYTGETVYYNQKLLEITSQLRSEYSTQYWRDIKLNGILTNGI